jgi:hypothetical protein
MVKRLENAEVSVLLIEADRIIQALVVKSDCRIDRNEEFFAAAQWKAKVSALGVLPTHQKPSIPLPDDSGGEQP